MTDETALPSTTDQAIAWVVRVNDPSFDDWTGFERWLAASPAHSQAYHAVAAAEGYMVGMLAPASRPIVPPVEVLSPAAAPPAVRPRRSRRWPAWGGGAIAAAVVATIGYQQLRTPAVAVHVYQTAPGAQRAVELADGSRVTLNGATRLTVGADGRTARLERGEALFHVRHDAATPFSVAIGDATVVDIGTVFDVVRDGSSSRVAVAEGAVDWRVADKAVRIEAGRGLRAEDGRGEVTLVAVATQAVGDWSRGEVSFDGTPLATAAADLSRALGVDVTVASSIAGRPVRGAVGLQGGAETVVRRFAALLGLAVRHDGRGWRLIAPS